MTPPAGLTGTINLVFTATATESSNGSNASTSGSVTLNIVGYGSIINGGVGADSLVGAGGNDTMSGGNGNDTMAGGAGNDSLNGGAGNDTLDGGTGNDTMTGGAGNDIYIVDTTTDVIIENAGEGTDSVQSSVTYTLSTNVENLTFTGSSNINGTGNASANTITGNTGNNSLSGLDGNDTLDGGA